MRSSLLDTGSFRHLQRHENEVPNAPEPRRLDVKSALKGLIGRLVVMLAVCASPSSAEEINRLFTPIEDPARLGKIVEYNAADVARYAALARRYRIVEVDTDLLRTRKPFHLNLFEDTAVLVETVDFSTGLNEYNRVWRGHILDFGQPRKYVETFRSELTEAPLPAEIAPKLMEATLLRVNGFLASFDVDAETGVANLSGQRRFGHVGPNPSSKAPPHMRGPWNLVHEAFHSLSISQLPVPQRDRMAIYSVSPLKWSPKYHIILESDPNRIVSSTADPAERKALVEESLKFERSLPPEDGKVMIGEIE